VRAHEHEDANDGIIHGCVSMTRVAPSPAAADPAYEADLVSVIIPCFQQGRFLTACVESLLAQSYPRWEAIVVNDGSTDDTAAVAAALVQRDPRVRDVSQPNAGLASARNLGLSEARGEYVAFLDADDLFEPRKLECQVAHLRRHPDLAAACGTVKYFDTDAPGVFRPRLSPGDDPDWIARAVGREPLPLSSWIWHNRIPVCSPVVRRRLVDEIGPFDTTLVAYEDWDFWLRAVIAGCRFGFVAAPESDCLIRVHRSSLSAQPGVADDRLFRARAVFHRRLGSGHARERRLNLRLMLLSGMAAGPAGRTDRHTVLRSLPLSWTEKRLAEAAMAIERTGLPFARLKNAVRGWAANSRSIGRTAD
jgi:glycosyltransferase involved in cell wall biosynthesis